MRSSWLLTVAFTVFLCSYVGALVTVADFLNSPGSFFIFMQELKRTGFEPLLTKKGLKGSEITIFAPTDKAMNEFGLLGLLRGPERVEMLKKFIGYHIGRGNVARGMLIRNSRRKVKTFGGGWLKLQDIRKHVLYTVKTDTGIIHVIKKVLVHPELSKLLFR